MRLHESVLLPQSTVSVARQFAWVEQFIRNYLPAASSHAWTHVCRSFIHKAKIRRTFCSPTWPRAKASPAPKVSHTMDLWATFEYKDRIIKDALGKVGDFRPHLWVNSAWASLVKILDPSLNHDTFQWRVRLQHTSPICNLSTLR